MRLIDLTGQKFSRLTVLERAENVNRGDAQWRCLCDCGNTTVARANNLKNRTTKSCGCLKLETSAANKRTHGFSDHPVYKTYKNMRARCYKNKARDYKNYGGRGIYIVKEWLDDPAKFVEWSLANGWEPGLSIDRKDNDGPYAPDNCQWITMEEQCRNKQKTIRVTYMGEERPLCDLIDESGLPYFAVYKRLTKLGWSIERALTEPVRKMRSRLHVRIAGMPV